MKKINIETIPSAYERSMLIFLGYSGDVCVKCSFKDIELFKNTYLPDIAQKVAMPSIEEICANQVRFYDSASEKYEKLKKDAYWKIAYAKWEQINKEVESFIIDEDITDDEKTIQKNILNFLLEGVNSGIYNICNVIIMFDKITESFDDFIECIELKWYDEASICLSDINSSIIFAESAITHFIISMDKKTMMDYSLHHRILPDLPFYLNSTKKILGCLDLLQEKMGAQDEDEYFLICCPIYMDMIKAKKKVDILKFIFAFICIIRSPEYSREWKEYAYEIIKMYKDILYKGTIYKVYLQRSQLTGTKGERGSNNGVTRVQFLFELCNDDIYSLRLDMPHKGEEYVHANMEELYHGRMLATGFPIHLYGDLFEEIKELCEDKYCQLFWEYENRLWFRTNFESKLKKIDLPEENRKMLGDIFNNQRHRRIKCSMNEENAIDFWNEINIYLERFRLTNIVETNIKKDDEKMIKSFEKIYLFQDYYSFVLDFLMKKPDLQLPLKKFLYKSYKSFGLEENDVDEKTFLEMDLKNNLHLIDIYGI